MTVDQMVFLDRFAKRVDTLDRDGFHRLHRRRRARRSDRMHPIEWILERCDDRCDRQHCEKQNERQRYRRLRDLQLIDGRLRLCRWRGCSGADLFDEIAREQLVESLIGVELRQPAHLDDV